MRKLKVITYCDRCKKEFEKWNQKRFEAYGIAEFVYDEVEPYLDKPYDLCESCYNELEKWWNFQPQAESEDKECF
ncbi:hypothetical protein SAMN05660484_02606 [Eubacterium ruminantium]|uniref:Uncharacterized protein n=1 Tax=Eubacterium ruminantium TaxID=42322 RepID=A0A1T4QWX5_9FIRM|nr:hypothetical protein [Eubacterium ruminantium]SCW70548.1 hypothetical protein SAMN05660484_02606 [Eubacterium ruminantium]SDN48001.1 hypothetical protein SAMN04490370_1314 [Eubacterium ruminantium]SKA08077.1 hypothetical protein SAMN02745110_02546 [Eubacterium ruminantium]